jgi:hypothetical protein
MIEEMAAEGMTEDEIVAQLMDWFGIDICEARMRYGIVMRDEPGDVLEVGSAPADEESAEGANP